jgi:fumarate reductase subunit D
MQQMIFIADLIAFSTCFGHHYAHHQELERIIQVVAACGIWCFGFQVVGMVWN